MTTSYEPAAWLLKKVEPDNVADSLHQESIYRYKKLIPPFTPTVALPVLPPLHFTIT